MSGDPPYKDVNVRFTTVYAEQFYSINYELDINVYYLKLDYSKLWVAYDAHFCYRNY